MSTRDLRALLHRATFINVRVTSRGFEHGTSTAFEIEGYAAKAQVVRKLFENRALACYSGDGITGRDGARCQSCPRLRCQPMIRLHFRQPGTIFVIDLATTSAQNYLRIAENAEAVGEQIHEWPLRLTVINRGHWGEVDFERLEGEPVPLPLHTITQSDM